MGRQGIAEIESFHNLNLTSKVEVSILVIIEKLHKAKLNTILKLSLLQLNYNQNSNENNNHNTIKEEVINYKLNYKIINSYIQNTISYALHDFPLNPIFLSSYILTNIHSTLGYLNIRSYFKNIHLYDIRKDPKKPNICKLDELFKYADWFMFLAEKEVEEIAPDLVLCVTVVGGDSSTEKLLNGYEATFQTIVYEGLPRPKLWILPTLNRKKVVVAMGRADVVERLLKPVFYENSFLT
jgi:hypothetical protein